MVHDIHSTVYIKKKSHCHLETLSVNDSRSGFIVLLFADPHLLEGGERSQDGATDPHGVLPLWWSDDLDLHGRWSHGGELLLHPVGDSWEHSGSSGHDDVGVEILADIDVALHDAAVSCLVDAGKFFAEEGRLEKNFRCSESFVADGDDLTVRELVALLQGGTGSSSLHLLLEVQSNVAELLLDVTNDLTLG